MKDYYLLNEKKIEYKNIINELTNVETDCYVIDTAFVENSTVFIGGTLKPSVSVAKATKLLPLKYAPRYMTNGTWGCSYDDANLNKIAYVRIGAGGEIDMWINNLIGGEHFTFVYPLKVQ